MYRIFGFDCIGNETGLATCPGSGSECSPDSPAHAVAISCGGFSSAKVMAGQ